MKKRKKKEKIIRVVPSNMCKSREEGKRFHVWIWKNTTIKFGIKRQRISNSNNKFSFLRFLCHNLNKTAKKKAETGTIKTHGPFLHYLFYHSRVLNLHSQSIIIVFLCLAFPYSARTPPWLLQCWRTIALCPLF